MNTRSNSSNPQIAKLPQQLKYLQQEQFTGRLQIKSSEELQWQVYFCLGRLVWADGGEHSNRSWKRHLAKYCPQLNRSPLLSKYSAQWECPKYQFLILSLQEKLVNLQEIKSLVQNKIEEVLFDILQQETSQQLEYKTQEAFSYSPLALMLTMPPVLINTSLTLATVQISCSEWIQAGLRFYSPNLAPCFTQSYEMLQIGSNSTHQKLSKLLNGKYTLRDLAYLMERDIQKLALFLVPYIRKGTIKLLPVKDIALLNNSIQPQKNHVSLGIKSPGNKPLILAVSENSNTWKAIAVLLEKSGYEFIHIHDGLQAINSFISSQPDLILLDAQMPIVNGYEIAAQIQRLPHLKKTPVVMITNSINPFNHLRAKSVGVSSLITKPTNFSQILSVVNEFAPSAYQNSHSQEVHKYRGVSYSPSNTQVSKRVERSLTRNIA
jgi:two-component system, chemotaxis family, response regulator PixG